LLCVDDIELIGRHAEEMLREAGRNDTVLATMTKQIMAWLEPRLHDGTYYEFRELGQSLSPYRTVAAWYLWRSMPQNNSKARNGVLAVEFRFKVFPLNRSHGHAHEFSPNATVSFTVGILFG